MIIHERSFFWHYQREKFLNQDETHKKLHSPNIAECSHCHHPKLSHRACPNCGYYSGRMVVVPKEG
jgi:ribosomal protein L32